MTLGQLLTKMINNLSNPLDAYPVGSIYMSVNSTSPATLFGGTWEQITSDAYLKIVTSGGGSLGGTSSDHKIPVSSMPSHNHTIDYNGANNFIRWLDGGGGNCALTSGDECHGYMINGMSNTGDGEAYYPYYLGVYVWKRTA